MRPILVASGLYQLGDGGILVQERPKGVRYEGLFEFPGGKVEHGETLRQTVAREWKEELNVDVEVGEWVGECIVLPSDFPGSILIELFRVRFPFGNKQHFEPMIGQTLRVLSVENLIGQGCIPSMYGLYPHVVKNLSGVDE